MKNLLFAVIFLSSFSAFAKLSPLDIVKKQIQHCVPQKGLYSYIPSSHHATYLDEIATRSMHDFFECMFEDYDLYKKDNTMSLAQAAREGSHLMMVHNVSLDSFARYMQKITDIVPRETK
ncbi:hypothetical protein HBN50_03425 [Halobacteriovorax sp. GB3]|uniref:hypothetical protein n=1 Tax=Halobacteriovorax sp. GB3 TaxID=2719615 RepID=UPI002361532B|nr:hypothetical protein [Halobacteriovorax sp. GB3]MDD0852128.1 hypothetical protein [Halobacteriovorax sp. GB3]